MRVLRCLPVLLVLLGLAKSAAAQTRLLSLGDAIALAVRQNPSLAAAGADVEIAEASILAARGLDDIIVEASADWRGTQLDAPAGTPVQQRAFNVVLGSLALTQPLATGGRLGLLFQAGYSRIRAATDVDGMAVERWASGGYTPSLQLALTQPLLRGFGVNVARADRRRAQVQRDLAGAQREGLAAALVRDVVIAYWNLAYSEAELVIRRGAAEAAREQLLRVEANIAVGKLPRSASAEIEVAIAFRDDSALAAEQAVTDRSLSLGSQCGVSLRERLVAADPVPLAETLSSTSLEAELVVEKALAQNPQLQTLREQERADAVEIGISENRLLPQLDFTLTGGRLGDLSDPSLADRQLTGFAGTTVTAGLAFSLPIGRHVARAARDAAYEQVRKSRLGESGMAQQVTAVALRGLARLQTARRRAEVLAPSERAAALDLEAEKARFEVGRSSNFDVLRRQDQLAAVRLLLLQARVDHLQAIAELEALTGEILDRNGVVMAGGDR